MYCRMMHEVPIKMRFVVFVGIWTSLFVILQNVLVVRAAGSPCPKGSWIHGNRCFVLVTQHRRTWADANAYCSSLGSDEQPMELVTITDNATNTFLMKKLTTISIRGKIWIGLHDIVADNEWQWVDGRPLGNFTNWHEGRIHNRESSNCACFKLDVELFHEKYKYKWETGMCDSDAPFICSTREIAPLCPNGGHFFRDRCYWYGRRGTLPFDEADKACQEEFGKEVRLLVVRDAEVNTFIGRLLGIWSPWLGMHDMESEQTWKWIDGTPVVYTNWYPGEPNNRDVEDCAVIYSSGWNDVSCAEDRRYVCAIPPCYEGPDADTDYNCSMPCTSCVSDAVCFAGGGCKCVAEFDGMVCDKGAFSMSIAGPTVTSIGVNIKLSCNVNIPLRDVQLEWNKLDSNGTRHTILGYTSSKRQGSYELHIVNATDSDQGVYYCIGTYTIGEFSQVKVAHAYLEVSTPAGPLVLRSSSSPKTGLSVTLAILSIACAVLCVGLIVVIQRYRSLKPSNSHVTLSQLVE